MFFLIERHDTLALHPKCFGADIPSQILEQLRLKVEGKCSGRYGYTILVTTLNRFDQGKLDIDSGFAHVKVVYMSLVFRPFKNEVLLATISRVNEQGFFADAGPAKIFVSHALMPDGYVFDASTEGLPEWVLHYEGEEDLKLRENSQVRIKVIGIRHGADQIGVIGSIKDDFLGTVEE